MAHVPGAGPRQSEKGGPPLLSKLDTKRQGEQRSCTVFGRVKGRMCEPGYHVLSKLEREGRLDVGGERLGRGSKGCVDPRPQIAMGEQIHPQQRHEIGQGAPEKGGTPIIESV